MQQTVAYLRKLGKQVVMYGPSPEYWVIVPLQRAYEQFIGIDLGRRLLLQDRRPLDAKFR